MSMYECMCLMSPMLFPDFGCC